MSEIIGLPAPSVVDWPRDEAAHDGLPWEIWWITAIVRSGRRRFSSHVMLTHLPGARLGVSATITDLELEREFARRITAEPDQVVLATDRLEVATELGSFRGSFQDGYSLTAHLDDDAGFDLALQPTTPVLHNCGGGQFALGKLTTTQYSIGGLVAAGILRVGGQVFEVEGRAWYDRQWIHSGSLEDSGGAFTWFGVSLDSGVTLSLWDTSMRPQGWHTWATVARLDGTHIVTPAEPAAHSAQGRFRTPQGHDVPRRWTLAIPALQAQLQVDQRLAQDAPGRFFYTGALEVTGTCEGQSVNGYGFCDLVGWAN